MRDHKDVDLELLDQCGRTATMVAALLNRAECLEVKIDPPLRLITSPDIAHCMGACTAKGS